jgi:nucleotide-binding universal stress UspA family protein
MMESRKILFPVDLTGFSAKIIPRVLLIAKKFDAEIHLVFVAGTFEQYSTFFVPHPSLNEFEEENVLRAQRKLGEFADEHFSDYPQTKAIVLRGDPVEEINKYVDAAGIDMIIVASHGRRGFEKVVFGSIADAIISSASVPVLCIKPDMEKEKWKFAGEFAGDRITSEAGRTGLMQ